MTMCTVRHKTYAEASFFLQPDDVPDAIATCIKGGPLNFNPYSAEFFYFVHFDISFCLGISRKGTI